jgi:hypothetical protein
MGVALTLVVAHAASGAIQYDFIQTSRSDSGSAQPLDFTARAIIDGNRSRVDFLGGNAYPPGTYVISNNNARQFLFVDPTQKSYTELNTMTVASALGTSDIKIENFTSSVTKLEDRPVIAGIPADHYRLTMTYDITVTFRAMPLKQSVRTTIDKWTTIQFGDSVDDAFAGATLQTGNPDLDKLIAAEATRIRGFPLRQSFQVVTTNLSAKSNASSPLRVPMTHTRVREVTVTSIGEVKSDPRAFHVPTDYRKVNFAEGVPKSQTQVLSLEPSSE